MRVSRLHSKHRKLACTLRLRNTLATRVVFCFISVVNHSYRLSVAIARTYSVLIFIIAMTEFEILQ